MPWVYRMTSMLALLLLPFFIYVGFRLSTAIAKITASKRITISKKTARIIVFSVILWFYLLPITLVIYYLSGNFHHLFVFNPQLQWQDYVLLFPFWWGVLSLLEIFPYFVVLDIITGLSRLKIFSRASTQQPEPQQPQKPLWPEYLKVGIVIFFLFYVGIRTHLDTNRVRISTSQVAIENLPEEFQGLRLCLFSDIHVDRFTREKKLEKLKTTLQAGNEDLILFTGDLVSRGLEYIDRSLALTCNPQGKIANIACMGDHDYWTAPRKISGNMKQCGWIFLQNSHYLIPYKGHQILVTGVTHIYSQRISTQELEKLLEKAPDAQLKILVAHQPLEPLVETAAQYGYHLVLAGHTHGGQIVHHILGIPISPGQMETRFCWGQHQVKGLQLIVTNGIGQTLAPLRYHAPAEITRITLVKK